MAADRGGGGWAAAKTAILKNFRESATGISFLDFEIDVLDTIRTFGAHSASLIVADMESLKDKKLHGFLGIDGGYRTFNEFEFLYIGDDEGEQNTGKAMRGFIKPRRHTDISRSSTAGSQTVPSDAQIKKNSNIRV